MKKALDTTTGELDGNVQVFPKSHQCRIIIGKNADSDLFLNGISLYTKRRV